MSPLCDMHCHILPGVDDGAKTMDEALDLLEEEYRQGVRAIILTPHFRKEMFETPRSVCLERLQALSLSAKERQKKSPGMFEGLHVYLGTEFHVNQDMTETLKTDPAYRMNGTDYVLTEFSSYHTESEVRTTVNNLLIEGWIPIIAHIERYPACRKMQVVEDLRSMGALIQVNADAILGREGFGNRHFTGKLLAQGLVDLIGSDAHNMKSRAPHMSECATYIEKKFGLSAARKLMWSNPLSIAEGRKL